MTVKGLEGYLFDKSPKESNGGNEKYQRRQKWTISESNKSKSLD